MAITRLNTNAVGTSVNLTSNVTGTLPIANGGTAVTTAADLANTGNFVLISSASSAAAASHVIATDFTAYNFYKLFYSVCYTAGSANLNFSISTDNFSTVTNIDGLYSYFQVGSDGSAGSGNIAKPNDGLNESAIRITANSSSGDNAFGEMTLKGGTVHTNGSGTRRNQFFWGNEIITHQGTGIYIERVTSQGQVARALAGSESTTPTHIRFTEESGDNIEFSYRLYGVKV